MTATPSTPHIPHVDGSAPVHAIVVTGGGALSAAAAAVAATAPAGTPIIAADSGLDHAVAAGLSPTMLVGDLDSISAAGRMWAYAHGVVIDEHSPVKDSTDTALAIAAALDLVDPSPGTSTLTLLSGAGDRLDHTLGVLTALGHKALARCAAVRAVVGDATVHVIHSPGSCTLDAPDGATFSAMVVHGGQARISITGASYPLDRHMLRAGSTLGLSNISDGHTVVAAHSGVVTVVVP